MIENNQSVLSRALLTLLRPLVRILLRNGIAYGSFAEIARKAYIDVAWEEFPPPGKKQSISHVSTLTGLTRKEAKRLHELSQAAPDTREQKYNRVVRVISGWVNDPQFLDHQGRPRVLPAEGEEASFHALVKKYSGDVTTRAMRSVLVQSGSARELAEGIELVQHAYVPGRDPGEKLNILGIDCAELIDTIDHNLTAGNDQLRFQRKVSDHCLRADALGEFQSLASRRAQALLEELDAWISRHQSPPADADSARYVSLGIYLYEKPTRKEHSS